MRKRLIEVAKQSGIDPTELAQEMIDVVSLQITQAGISNGLRWLTGPEGTKATELKLELIKLKEELK